jgi:hypothetical protein
MKFMILTYGSQLDYDAIAAKSGQLRPVWSPQEFAGIMSFMRELNAELADLVR